MNRFRSDSDIEANKKRVCYGCGGQKLVFKTSQSDFEFQSGTYAPANSRQHKNIQTCRKEKKMFLKFKVTHLF